ncbi:hypothetical protein [Frankia sp. AvcI1]|uniref:hypothetical protein n=1 Tax=Frankia sp. AvcI1 TaxID=573496 RepID=UPI0006EBF826|nr:hypothetical protein [Frankia sp. AvcI1]
MNRIDPLFTADQIEPNAADTARARARVAGQDWRGTHLVASSALCVRMPGLMAALTMPGSVDIAAGHIRHLIAVARVCDERFTELQADLDAQMAAARKEGE